MKIKDIIDFILDTAFEIGIILLFFSLGKAWKIAIILIFPRSFILFVQLWMLEQEKKKK